MTGARPLPPALRILTQERDRAADAAIAEALPFMDPAAQEQAVAVLIRRNHEPTLQGLVARYRGSDALLRGAIVKGVPSLHAVIRQAASSDDPEESESALQLVIDAKDAKLAYLLADAVRSTRATSRQLAATGLKQLTDQVVTGDRGVGSPSTQPGPDGRLDAMAEALREVVQKFEPSAAFTPVEAALWLGDRVEPALLEKLHEPHGKLVDAVNRILAAPKDPRLAGAVLRALATPELRASAIHAFSTVQEPAMLRALMHEAWLLGDIDIRRGLQRVPEGKWMDAWLLSLPSVDGDDACRAVRILSGVGGSAERKWSRLRPLLDDARPAVRRELFWRMVDESTDASTDLLRTLATGPDVELRELSMRECRRRQVSQGNIGPPPAMAADDPFEKFVADFDKLTPEERRAAVERIKGLNLELPRRLQGKLASGDPIERCRAIRAARSLGQLSAVSEKIFALAGDPEKIVRSAAMTALADLPGPTSIRLLRNAMNDPDDRVQANAIDSLDHIQMTARSEVLLPKLGSANNRVRANAIRALLRLDVREAGDALLDMLEDSSRAHRASALWVVERLQLRAVLDRVAELSRSDEDARVRLRAQRILQQMSQRPPRHRRTSRVPHGGAR